MYLKWLRTSKMTATQAGRRERDVWRGVWKWKIRMIEYSRVKAMVRVAEK